MSKFDQICTRVVENMNNNPIRNMNTPQSGGMPADQAAAGYESMGLDPQKKAAVSKAITTMLNSNIPKAVATPGFNSSANVNTTVASAINKVKSAGTKALDTIGNMTVKDILGIAKNVITTPIQIQQAALRNVAQAGVKTGQDVANILMNVAKQKGASDQDIDQILREIEQEMQKREEDRISGYMQG